MHRLFLLGAGTGILLIGSLAHAADATVAPMATLAPVAPLAASQAGSSPLLTMVVSLMIVLGAIIAVAFVFKRFGVRGAPSTRMMRVVSQLPLGTREKIAVVEIDDRWFIIGVTPQQITLLKETAKSERIEPQSPPPPSFARMLQRAGLRQDRGQG